jgi:hypothetical protein
MPNQTDSGWMPCDSDDAIARPIDGIFQQQCHHARQLPRDWRHTHAQKTPPAPETMRCAHQQQQHEQQHQIRSDCAENHGWLFCRNKLADYWWCTLTLVPAGQMRFLPGPRPTSCSLTAELEMDLTAISLDHDDGGMCRVIFDSIIQNKQRSKRGSSKQSFERRQLCS